MCNNSWALLAESASQHRPLAFQSSFPRARMAWHGMAWHRSCGFQLIIRSRHFDSHTIGTEKVGNEIYTSCSSMGGGGKNFFDDIVMVIIDVGHLDRLSIKMIDQNQMKRTRCRPCDHCRLCSVLNHVTSCHKSLLACCKDGKMEDANKIYFLNSQELHDHPLQVNK